MRALVGRWPDTTKWLVAIFVLSVLNLIVEILT